MPLSSDTNHSINTLCQDCFEAFHEFMNANQKFFMADLNNLDKEQSREELIKSMNKFYKVWNEYGQAISKDIN